MNKRIESAIEYLKSLDEIDTLEVNTYMIEVLGLNFDEIQTVYEYIDALS